MDKPRIGDRVQVVNHSTKVNFKGMVMRNFPREEESRINGDNGASTKVGWRYLEYED